MNINATSTAMPKFQSIKRTQNVNFTGFEKVTQTAGEAAATAASKAGITDKIVKVLSAVLEGLKNLGNKILDGFKKLFNTNTNVCTGKNKIIYVANGKRVSAEEFNDAFKGFDFDTKLKNINETPGILQKDGKTYIYGKLYKPGYKLPEGVVIGKHGLSISTEKGLPELMEELKRLSEEWE